MIRYFAAFFSVFCLTTLAIGQEPERVDWESPFGLMGFPYSHAKNDPQVFEKAETRMELYKLTGARWDRRDFWWGVVQPEPGVWEWDYFDRSMQDFIDHRVNLVVILCYGSAWYGDAPATDEEIEAFGEYAYQMTNRYGHWVKHWEVWNEPNILPFWAPHPNVENYTKLLQTAYTRIKEADPDATVLGGAMAGADPRFLRGMYENGAKGYFDALSYHTYGNNPTWEGQKGEADSLRVVMAEYDDMKPLWLTETGIYTGPAGVPDEIQAQRIVKSEIRWVALGLVKMFQLTLQDWTADENHVDATSFRGLATAGGAAKPSFHAHRQMVERLVGMDCVGRYMQSDDMEGYVFTDEGRNVWVTWLKDEEAEENVTLILDSDYALLHDLYGGKRLVQRNGSTFVIPMSGEPVYIDGIGDSLVLAAATRIEAEPMPAAQKSTVNVTVSNPTDMPVEFILAIDEDNRFLAEETFQVALEAGASEDYEFTVQPAASLEPGPISLPMMIRTMDGQTIINEFDVEISPSVSLAFNPLQQFDWPKGDFGLSITNYTDKAIDDTIRFTAASADSDASDEGSFSLKPGGKIDLVTALDGMNWEPGGIYTITARTQVPGSRLEEPLVFRPVVAPRAPANVTIDGDLSDWSEQEKTLLPEMFTEVDFNPALNEGMEDVTIDGWMGWDEQALYIALQVKDDALYFPISTVFWDFDSLQLAFDPLNDAGEDESFNRDDVEIEVTHMRDGSNMIYAGRYPDGFIKDVVENESELAVQVDEESGTVTYEMRLPKGVVPALQLEKGRVFGFSLIHNDNDKGNVGDREGWLELTEGIGYGKVPWYFKDVILVE